MLQVKQALLQPKPGGHQHLVVPAAPGVDATARIAKALGQPGFDRGMAVLVARVEHERPGLECSQQLIEPF